MFRQRNTPRVIAILGLLLLAAWLPRACADSFPWDRYQGYPKAWFDGYEAKQIATNVLSHQTSNGSWPRDVDTGAKKFEGELSKLIGTFGGGASIGELRFLARLQGVAADEKYHEALEKGLKVILDSQFTGGGWPISSPPPKSHAKHIAFHDLTMVNLLLLMRDVCELKDFTVARKDTREKARHAFARGVECTVKCQIEVEGTLTGWCAWHDEKTLQPIAGRSSEPASISACDTAGVLIFLMTLDQPHPLVIRSVHAGCQWMESVKLVGIKIMTKNGDKFVVRDKAALPLWARSYQIGTNRPLFAKADGTLKYKMSDIEAAQRADIAWYGTWGRPVLEAYASWKDRYPLGDRLWAIGERRELISDQ